MAEQDQRYFEDVKIGDTIPGREHGPLSVVDTVRWAGFQENWIARLHYDRDQARKGGRIRSFLASGSYREALIARMITEWVGAEGRLRKFNIRQTAPTIEGDLMRFSGTVVEKSPAAGDPWLTCEIEGTNQDGEQIVRGQCTVVLPSRAGGQQKRPATRPARRAVKA